VRNADSTGDARCLLNAECNCRELIPYRFPAFFSLIIFWQIMKKRTRLHDRSIDAELQRAHELFAQTRYEARQTLIRAIALAEEVQIRFSSKMVLASPGRTTLQREMMPTILPILRLVRPFQTRIEI
jgi:hypothetical protein